MGSLNIMCLCTGGGANQHRSMSCTHGPTDLPLELLNLIHLLLRLHICSLLLLRQHRIHILQTFNTLLPQSQQSNGVQQAVSFSGPVSEHGLCLVACCADGVCAQRRMHGEQCSIVLLQKQRKTAREILGAGPI